MGLFDRLDYYYKWMKDPKNKSISNLIILFFIGAVLLIFSKILTRAAPTSQNITSQVTEPPLQDITGAQQLSYVERLEKQLANALSQVQGIKNVDVVITLEEEELLEPAFNVTSNEKISEELDGDGGVRTITEIQSTQQAIILRKGNDDTAMILKKSMPKIKGVLIVAEGADLSVVAEKIIKATSTLLDIPLYKVSLLSK